jgi:DNA repair protein RecN (Recombination protein N)
MLPPRRGCNLLGEVPSVPGGSIRPVLRELHISGLGVIEDVTVELAPGLNVLTGETGAGKTMVTVGLALALGRRARSGMVRGSSGKAGVEALFDSSSVPAAGDWAEDGQLVLARTIAADGRSSARAGGQLAPLGTLTELGSQLVEIHGQHQTQRLLALAAQLEFLDRFAGSEHLRTVASYRAVHSRLQGVRSRLTRLAAEEREREREKDLVAYQAREIEAAGIHPGELGELRTEESRLVHAEGIRERAGEAEASLSADGGGADRIRVAAAALHEVAAVDPGAGELSRRADSLAAEAADLGEELRSYTETVELDPLRLDQVRDRLADIRFLERKYGEGEEAVLGFLAEALRRLENLEGTDQQRDRLAEEARALAGEAEALGAAISEGRRGAAPRLAAALESELQALGMEGAGLEVRLEPEREPGPDGRERATFVFTGGPGQEPQPLSRVASGGELSRVMLACRTVLADLDDVPTLVFDEVDAGIGGRAGVAVGRRLARLARRRQVLVVTHLPQIACFADRHLSVTKEEGTARVLALEEGDRIEELSRMLSGLPTDEAATHAEQLLAEAAREKA